MERAAALVKHDHKHENSVWICELKSISDLYMETACWNSLEPRTHAVQAFLLCILPTEGSQLLQWKYQHYVLLPQNITLHKINLICFPGTWGLGLTPFPLGFHIHPSPFAEWAKGTCKRCNMSHLPTIDFSWDGTLKSKLPSFSSAQNK